jgi:hypothetical protein
MSPLILANMNAGLLFPEMPSLANGRYELMDALYKELILPPYPLKYESKDVLYTVHYDQYLSH